MKSVLWIIAGLLSVSLSFASPFSQLGGQYTCKGYDPTDVAAPTYTGRVNVTKQGQQYILNEVDEESGSSINYDYNEFAILTENDKMSGTFEEVTNTDEFGVVAFTVRDRGKEIDSRFAYWNIPKVIGTERCRAVAPHS